MRPVLSCTHARDAPPNLLTRALGDGGLEIREANLQRDDALPALDDVSAMVSFGGQMSVLDIDRFPFLVAERSLLAAAVAAGVPVLGVCLGSQLLASATGGDVVRLPERFVAFPELVREPGADDDALFAGLPEGMQVIEWHEDAVVAPPRSIALAETVCHGRSVYRIGPSAWGTQIHLELDARALEAVLEDPSEIAQLVESGVDPAWFAATGARVLVEQARLSEPILARFVAFVVARERAAG